jgi:hypothetical protein
MLEEKYEPDAPASGFDGMYLASVSPADDHHHFGQSDLDRVQRRLKQRHVQMCAPLPTRSQ